MIINILSKPGDAQVLVALGYISQDIAGHSIKLRTPNGLIWIYKDNVAGFKVDKVPFAVEHVSDENDDSLPMPPGNFFTILKKAKIVKVEHIADEEEIEEQNKVLINAEAMRILQDKDVEVIGWLCKTVGEFHVGDENAVKSLVISLIDGSVKNSEGIHPALHGASGKGKTAAAKAVKHITPKDRVFETSVTPMALYYAASAGLIKEGTVIYSDDTDLKEETRVTIKRSSTNFQEETLHLTVIHGEPVFKAIPRRIVWWLTSVRPDSSDQVLNRQFQHDVDESEDQDNKVHEHQKKLLASGAAKFPETSRVLVAREVLRIVCDGIFRVNVLYTEEMDWKNKGNRRNFPLFGDILRCYTVANRYKRDMKKIINESGEEEEVVMADKDDYENAKSLYGARAKNQELKLSAVEVKVYDLVVSRGKAVETTLEDIMSITGLAQTTARYLMIGTDGNGGMCAKVPGLSYEKQTITEAIGDPREGDRKGRPKKVFTYKAPKGHEGVLNNYEVVVELKEKPTLSK